VQGCPVPVDCSGEDEMEIRKTLHVTSREEWRAWLTKHYQSETEVWLIYYKKHTGQPRISYDHAVEEALCFGWVDSIVKRIDDEKFAQKFTPRRGAVLSPPVHWLDYALCERGDTRAEAARGRRTSGAKQETRP
jgi:hypothetical protein